MARSKKALALRAVGLKTKLAPRPKVDPVRRAMELAPYDDEPLTEEEVKALDEAEAEDGRSLSLSEMRRVLGLS